MRLSRLLLTACLILGIPKVLRAQQLAIGEWQSHFSYLSAKQIVQAGQRIFCTSYNGLFSVDQTGQNARTYSRINGLSDTGISAMAYHTESQTLIVAYRNGNIDLLGLDENAEISDIFNVPVIYNSADLPPARSVSKIKIRDDMAYLATAFGVVVLDIFQQDIRETYRYIGSGGAELKINDLAFSADSIHLATNAGLLSASMLSTVNRQYFASWKNSAFSENIVSVFVVDGNLYAGVPGKGIYLRQNGVWKTAYPSNAASFSLSGSGAGVLAAVGNQVISIPTDGQPETITAPLFSKVNDATRTGSNTLWAADQVNGLLLRQNGTINSVSPVSGDTTITPRPDSVLTDFVGQTWSILPLTRGGGISVLDKQTGVQKVLSTNAGSGSLPSERINSLSLDQDGLVWFASDKGVGYFVPEDVLSGNRVDAVLPIYGQRKLLSNEICTSIVTEPGNRKWIGTHKGLYLFSGDGTELVGQFNQGNSPLPSDLTKSLRFDDESGIVFIESDRGMMAYRSDASKQAKESPNVRIFPNPVLPGYGGYLGMTGLMENSTVKITTLSGRLVFETKSQGGTASWDLYDYGGKRASAGIYLLLANDSSGKSYVGKFAVID